MSAAASLRDSVPAKLPQLLGSECLHVPPPLCSPLANPPPHQLQPRALPAHPTPPLIIQCTAGVRRQSLTAQLPADARSAPPRFSDVSCVIPPRLGASDAAPAAPKSLPARTAAPRPAPRKSPTTATAPRATAPAHSNHQHPCTAGVRKHPITAQLPADARSVPLRSSDVSCVIPPRLGASDAAPSSPIPLTARTAAPPLAPRQNPPPPATPLKQHNPLQPRAQPPQPKTRSIISAQLAFASTRSQCSWPPMHAT
jgi:hypothetical protein